MTSYSDRCPQWFKLSAVDVFYAFGILVTQEQTLRELELRVKQQSVEVEKGNALRQKLTQEKAKLEIQIASISTELHEANRRCVKQ